MDGSSGGTVDSRRLEQVPGWDTFFGSLEEQARAVGSDGFSMGVVQGGRFHTYNVGFMQRTSATFASIAVSARLPGPEVYRTQVPLFFQDSVDAHARFPLTVAIDEGSPFTGAACLPLTVDGASSLGYLALHYVDAGVFDEAARMRLLRLAAGVAESLTGLLVVRRSPGAAATEAMDVAELRREVDGLRRAMESRAVIEQAKGMLMERYGIDADRAWRVLLRWSSERERKVRDVSTDVVSGQSPDVLPE